MTDQTSSTELPQPPAIPSQQQNELKAFFNLWYAKFDRREPWDQIRSILPDGEGQWTYPNGEFDHVDQLEAYAVQSRAAIVDAAHELGAISVNRTTDTDVFELVAPHRYLLKTAEGQAFETELIGKMRVQQGLATKADPTAALPKVTGYNVVPYRQRKPIDASLISANRFGTFNESDAKAFVFSWFANLDKADANAIMAMTSDGQLNVDLLGQKFPSKSEFREYLAAQAGAQSWAKHTPHNIRVEAVEDGFDVSFLVAFEGAIPGMGVLNLNNLTRWKLIPENDALRLRDYSLVML